MEVCTNLLPLLLIERKRTTRAEENKIYFTILRSWQYTFTKTQVTRSSKKKKKTQVTLADTHGTLVEQKKTTRAEEKKNYFTILTSWQYTFTKTQVTRSSKKIKIKIKKLKKKKKKKKKKREKEKRHKSHLLRHTRHFIFALQFSTYLPFTRHINSHKYTCTHLTSRRN